MNIQKPISLLILFVVMCGSLMGSTLAGNHLVTLSVDFEKNIVLSRYDVDVYFDDIRIDTFAHGRDFTKTLKAEPGDHVIRFCDTDTGSRSGLIELTVHSDMTVACRIECKKNRIIVSNVHIEEKEPDLSETQEPEKDGL